MKYLKLFENWNETQKEELKKNYEEFVMNKDYIPNLLKEKIEESFGHNSPIIQQIKFESTWEPIAFNELSDTNSKLGFNSVHGPNLSDLSNVCVVGLLRITFDQFFTQKGDTSSHTHKINFSDETAVINERIDSALAKATEELGSKLVLPPNSLLDNTGSHGPNCFVRDKKNGTRLPPDSWYNKISGIRPPGNQGVWDTNFYDAKIVFTTWLVLDKSYCEDIKVI